MEKQVLFEINEWDSLKSQADFYRLDACRKLDSKTKSSNGQFMTPELIVSFMASLFKDIGNRISLLDPGAGVGSLTAGFVEEVYKRNRKTEIIEVDAFETEAILIDYLKSTLNECYQKCKNKNIQFSGHILSDDFIKFGSDELWSIGGLFKKQNKQYTHCIMNPPYKKIKSDSKHRSWLRKGVTP